MSEPDRFEAKAADLLFDIMSDGGGDEASAIRRIAAALRAAEASALERAAQRVAWIQPEYTAREVQRQIRALTPPAAAPAADYDPITAPIPDGDMNGPHGPLPAAETCPQGCDKPAGHEPPCGEYAPAAETGKEQGADGIGYCKTCGLDASHGVCNDPRDARIAELEGVLADVEDVLTECGYTDAQARVEAVGVLNRAASTKEPPAP